MVPVRCSASGLRLPSSRYPVSSPPGTAAEGPWATLLLFPLLGVQVTACGCQQGGLHLPLPRLSYLSLREASSLPAGPSGRGMGFVSGS